MDYVDHTIRVRYAETDQMGYVYYGNYAQYFEVARVEALRKAGVSYKALEQEGVMLPVVEFSIRYKKPAYYDDELTIRTWLDEIPTKSISFTYHTINADGVVLNEAVTKLVFVNIKSGRPVDCPEETKSRITKLFGLK